MREHRLVAEEGGELQRREQAERRHRCERRRLSRVGEQLQGQVERLAAVALVEPVAVAVARGAIAAVWVGQEVVHLCLPRDHGGVEREEARRAAGAQAEVEVELRVGHHHPDSAPQAERRRVPEHARTIVQHRRAREETAGRLRAHHDDALVARDACRQLEAAAEQLLVAVDDEDMHRVLAREGPRPVLVCQQQRARLKEIHP
mmetsp:Transcript_72614/g.218079  ORF Transcript_72614/g.218079 Transcript_72614/m.218079 type:complete len:203 (+) Transcript_72614:2-610(+)